MHLGSSPNAPEFLQCSSRAQPLSSTTILSTDPFARSSRVALLLICLHKEVTLRDSPPKYKSRSTLFTDALLHAIGRTQKEENMKIRGTSHIAIGVSNMERALHFYRDLLGLRVTLDDPNENPGGQLSKVSGQRTRHGVYLRWEDGPDAAFIVLSENRPTSGEPLKLNQVGIHHFAYG